MQSPPAGRGTCKVKLRLLQVFRGPQPVGVVHIQKAVLIVVEIDVIADSIVIRIPGPLHAVRHPVAVAVRIEKVGDAVAVRVVAGKN